MIVAASVGASSGALVSSSPWSTTRLESGAAPLAAAAGTADAAAGAGVASASCFLQPPVAAGDTKIKSGASRFPTLDRSKRMAALVLPSRRRRSTGNRPVLRRLAALRADAQELGDARRELTWGEGFRQKPRRHTHFIRNPRGVVAVAGHEQYAQ